jgi:hypothetical protein
MAEANPFDQFDKVTTPTTEVNPFDAITPTPTATVQSAVEQQPTPGFFTERAPANFDIKNVGVGVGIGAGLGTLLGGPIGAIGGGIAGGVSSAAGEVAKTMGTSEATQLGTEIIAGGLPSAFKKFGTKALGLISWRGGKLSNMLKITSDEELATLAAKEKAFGSPTFKGLYTTKTSDAVQGTLKNELTNAGIQVADDELASTAVRKQLYSNMSSTSPFVKSPEYAQLGDEIAALRTRNLISPKEEANLNKILMNQLNTNPKVAVTANKDILNLIQNGGAYTVEGETKTMISPDAQRLLREQFNKYLERNTGSKGYDILKNIEQQEFIAQSRDSIPTLVATKFSKLDEPYKLALANIAKSPDGRIEFAKAIDQHFYQLGETINVAGKEVGKELSPDKLMREFIRLRPAIEESKVMSRDQLENLTRRISGIPKLADKALATKQIADIIRGSLIGAGAAFVSTTERPPQVMPL